MFIYNSTTKVDPSIHDAWVAWMKETHIPAMMESDCFTDFQFVRILELDDSDGPTYAVQFKASSKANYNRYLQVYTNKLRNDSFIQWGNKVIGFRSLMQVVH